MSFAKNSELTMEDKVQEHIATMQHILDLISRIKTKSKLSTKKSRIFATMIVNLGVVFVNTQKEDLAKEGVVSSAHWSALENFINTKWNKEFSDEGLLLKDNYAAVVPNWYCVREEILNTAGGLIDSRYSKNSKEWKTFIEDSEALLEVL